MVQKISLISPIPVFQGLNSKESLTKATRGLCRGSSLEKF